MRRMDTMPMADPAEPETTLPRTTSDRDPPIPTMKLWKVSKSSSHFSDATYHPTAKKEYDVTSNALRP
jgi:hypothetical protein